MEYYTIIFLLIIGLFISFLEGLLIELTQDAIIQNNSLKPDSSKQIQKIWDNYEDYSISLTIFERLIYLLSFFFLGYLLFSLPFAFALVLCLFSCAILIITRNASYALGKRLSENIAVKFGKTIIWIAMLTKPVALLTNYLIKLIAGEKDEEAAREEISELVEIAREEGNLDDDEYRILKNIMKFSEVLVSDVMTPRTVIFSCKADTLVKDVINMPELRMYSRFPIWEGDSFDTGVIGYVMAKDVLHAALRGKNNKTLRDFKRDVYFIPENAPLDNALDRFLNRRQHIFIVVDEYGGVEGLITMEDVLETMLGVEIVDEADRFVDMRVLAKQRRDIRISNFEKK